jgi:hypothetical protein
MNRRILLALCLGMAFAAQAQDEQPAIDTGTDTLLPAPAAAPGTAVNEQEESPIGLYIMLWRNAAADQDADRPARLLRELLLPVDEDVFVRRVAYHQSLSRALAERRQVTPEP